MDPKNKDIKLFIASLPKAELHMHLEGSLEPELFLELASKNNLKTKYTNIEQLRQAYDFKSLRDFLDLYYDCVKVLKTKADFYQLAERYIKKAISQRVVHAEVFFDPQVHIHNGAKFEDVIDGIYEAFSDYQDQLSFHIFMSFLRDLPPEEGLLLLDYAKAYREKIFGIGLDSNELGNPPDKFIAVYKKAKAMGLALVAHAGEEAPAEYINQAILDLGVARVDHGYTAQTSAATMALLKDHHVALTLCPLSNLKLKVVKSLDHYPIRFYLDHDIVITINSDDPAYFGGYVNENYYAITRALNLSIDTLVKLAKNSLIASFIPPHEKNHYLAMIDQYQKENS